MRRAGPGVKVAGQDHQVARSSGCDVVHKALQCCIVGLQARAPGVRGLGQLLALCAQHVARDDVEQGGAVGQQPTQAGVDQLQVIVDLGGAYQGAGEGGAQRYCHPFAAAPDLVFRCEYRVLG